MESNRDEGRAPRDGSAVGVDLGGTKALFVVLGADGRERFRLRYPCAEFDGFDAMLARFVADWRHLAPGAPMPSAACVAVAGPVRGDRAALTNRPWTIEAERVVRALGGARVVLVNDFAAAAAGVAGLTPAGWRELQAGVPAEGCRAVVGAGTGLGVATMIPDGGRWRVVAGEGGHVGFAPRNALEVELWRWWHRGEERVSAERLLSGGGLAGIHRFVCARHGRAPGAGIADAADPAASISAAAQRADPDHDAAEALDLFASIYGAFAGDVALTCLPSSGVYIAGGIAPRVLDARRAARFVEAFRDKPPHGALMASIPVRLVVEPALGALGAAAIAVANVAAIGGAGESIGPAGGDAGQ